MSVTLFRTDPVCFVACDRLQHVAKRTFSRDRLMVYATFDHQPTEIAPDVMTKPVVDDVAGLGNNRRLSPILGFPAMTVPAGFTTDGLPVGMEFMARPYAEAMLFKFAYAYEQATNHRKPPASTPALRGEP